MPLLLLISCLFSSSLLLGQDNIQQAKTLCKEAIEKMESGQITPALTLLEKAQRLDPTNIDYPYEMAYAHYLDEDFSAALKILKKLVKRKDTNALVHQMLGNVYDLNGQTKKAITSYEEGLKLFPEAGILYLERGNMELKAGQYIEALDYYEKGIYVEPTFPSNYYWASKIYLNSSERIWGLLYGEIFMNLERNSPRTVEISKLLYDSYLKSIQINKKNKKETEIDVNLCRIMVMTVDELQEQDSFKMPFCMVYGTSFSSSIWPELETIDLNNLCTLRDRQIQLHYQNNYHKDYDNLLFQYQKQVQEKGYFEAYSHWILMKGDEYAFGAWLKDHEEEWKAFIEWFSENPLEITAENAFHSNQF